MSETCKRINGRFAEIDQERRLIFQDFRRGTKAFDREINKIRREVRNDRNAAIFDILKVGAGLTPVTRLGRTVGVLARAVSAGQFSRRELVHELTGPVTDALNALDRVSNALRGQREVVHLLRSQMLLTTLMLRRLTQLDAILGGLGRANRRFNCPLPKRVCCHQRFLLTTVSFDLD